MIFGYLLPQLSNLTELFNLDFNSWKAIDWSEVHFEFTEFQGHILKLFSAIFCVITTLIVVFWIKYGEVISERFIRPSEYAIEPSVD